MRSIHIPVAALALFVAASAAHGDSGKGPDRIALGAPPPKSRSGLAIRAADAIEGLIGSRGGAGGLALIALLGLAYGIIHALGPGHQKTLMAGIFVSEGGGAAAVVKAAGAAALGHAFSVLGIFGALAAAGGGLSLAGVDRAGAIVARASGLALSAFALANLVARIRSAAARARAARDGRSSGRDPRRDPGLDHEREHDHCAACGGHGHAEAVAGAARTGGSRGAGPEQAPSSGLKSIAALLLGSLVPCPGAAFFLLAGFAAGRPAAGVAAVLAISAGMWLTLIAVGLLASGTSRLGASGRVGRWAGLIRPAFEIGGAALVLAFAVALAL